MTREPNYMALIKVHEYILKVPYIGDLNMKNFFVIICVNDKDLLNTLFFIASSL